MTVLFLSILSVVLIFAAFKFCRKNWKFYKLKIPNLNLHPFLIDLFWPVYKLAVVSAEERFRYFAEFSLNYPECMKLWLGLKFVIFINSPDRIQKVLMSKKCLEKANFVYRLMDRDDGLIAASAKKNWKAHRKFFNFSFSKNILESFSTTFVEHSEILCKILETEMGKSEFDFFTYAKKISFDILCATSLGTDIKSFKTTSLYEKVFDAFET
jgi:cytochrome P450